MKKYKLRVSSSIVNFRKKAEKTWELERHRFPRDIFKPVVFFGLYHILDYARFMLHRGDRCVFWGGSDILNLLRKKPWQIVIKLFKAKHFVENEIEERELASIGIKAEVRPSFLEDINDFPISFKPAEKFSDVYLSARPDREKEYGVELVKSIAKKLPDIHFHIYGYDMPLTFTGVIYDNIVYEGKVSPKKFNEDIKGYHCGLRPNFHNGFSEITAKSVLLGQYPITKIKYPMIDNYETKEELIELLQNLKNKKGPNIKGREFWRKNVNNYPFLDK